MRYNIYFKGSLCNVLDDESRGFNLNMVRQSLATSCLVETGGIIGLPNGDILHINAEYGIFEGEYAPGEEGIEVYLESGNYFQLFYIVPDDDSAMSSYSGVFYSFSDCGVWNEYSVGSMLRIYTWNDSRDVYEICNYEFNEPNFSSVTTYTIVIDDSEDAPKWKLVNDTKYTGNTVITPNELIFVSSLSCVSIPEAGIWFTRQSGNDCYAFYIRDNEVINETQNFWFGSTGMPQTGDIIEIYDCGDYELFNQEGDFSRENISQYCELFYTLIFNGTKWICSSCCSVEDGGTILLSNGDILTINEKMGDLSHWGIEDNGIAITLDSGRNSFMLLHLNQLYYDHDIYETGHGIFYDVDEEYLYNNDNYIKIYIFSDEEGYGNFGDVLDHFSNLEYEEAEELLEEEYGIVPEIIQIVDGQWVLV